MSPTVTRAQRLKKEKTERKKGALIVLRDVSIAGILAVIIMCSLYGYTANWPPLVVIESASMMHGTDSQIGTIDTGDITLVKKVESRSEVVSYARGRATNYQMYGDYGDVVVYSPPRSVRADPTPVIHRPLIWIEYNETGGGFDVIELALLPGSEWETSTGSYYNLKDYVTLKNVGHLNVEVKILLSSSSSSRPSLIAAKHSGFITLGDNNKANYDQSTYTCKEPVMVEWLLGKAEGELPWFGLMKLYADGEITDGNPAPGSSVTFLWATVAILVIIPVALDMMLVLYDKKKAKEARESALRRSDKSYKAGEKPIVSDERRGIPPATPGAPPNEGKREPGEPPKIGGA